jgi:hypothetical protein
MKWTVRKANRRPLLPVPNVIAMYTNMQKKLPKPSEYQEQAKIFKWAALNEKIWPALRLLNASLNGVRLTIGQAKKAKAAGMKKGFPDLFLPVPRGIYHGLFIELKRVGGPKPTKYQRQWLEDLVSEGYDCYCCRGSDAAIATIKSYLKL